MAKRKSILLNQKYKMLTPIEELPGRTKNGNKSLVEIIMILLI